MLWQPSLCITLSLYFSPHLSDVNRNKVMKLETLPYAILNCMGRGGWSFFFKLFWGHSLKFTEKLQ